MKLARYKDSGERIQNSEVRIQEERKGPGGPPLYLEREPAKTFRDLVVWKHSHKFVLIVYQLTFPRNELFGLTSQLRRAAVSVAANMAEVSNEEDEGTMFNF
jgi:hypothetical protein